MPNHSASVAATPPAGPGCRGAGGGRAGADPAAGGGAQRRPGRRRPRRPRRRPGGDRDPGADAPTPTPTPRPTHAAAHRRADPGDDPGRRVRPAGHRARAPPARPAPAPDDVPAGDRGQGLPLDGAAVAAQVHRMLTDPRGWQPIEHVAFVRTAGPASFDLILASPTMVDRLCYPLDTVGELSCRNGNRVILNAKRWVDRGALVSPATSTTTAPTWSTTRSGTGSGTATRAARRRARRPRSWCSRASRSTAARPTRGRRWRTDGLRRAGTGLRRARRSTDAPLAGSLLRPGPPGLDGPGPRKDSAYTL